jgi:fibronectin type 3 domain-containing protein
VAAQHQVTLNWAAPVNSPVPVTGYNVYRATGTSGSFQLLNSSSISQTSYIDLTVVAATSYRYYATSVDNAGTESTPSNVAAVTVP